MLGNIISFFTILVSITIYYLSKNYKEYQPINKDIIIQTNTTMNKIITETKANLSSNNLQKLIFWSHGGPTFAIKDDPFGCSGAFNKVEALGSKIKNEYNPDYIVIISAHWQPTDRNSPDAFKTVYLSDTKASNDKPQENELIYDFYGFPDEMYSWKFKNTFNKQLINRITKLSDDTLIKIKPKVRGLDHGLWVPGKVAQLDKPGNNTDELIPVVQLSMLPDVPALSRGSVDIRETLNTHYNLGQLVNKIRADNGAVILSGMSVHNLRDLQSIFLGKKLPYAKQFDDYLRDLIIKDKQEKINKDYDTNSLYNGLMKLGEDKKLTSLLLQAHSPGIDHFLPFVIGCGALTNDEYFKEQYCEETGSLGWGIYTSEKVPQK
ncbi:hypothetical protein D499_0I00320 [Hanseniaspora uvarum DSM 2768]|nr:hypothetical protein D499_0I00320 [Hanseniaspora uvarum DSM 2768]